MTDNQQPTDSDSQTQPDQKTARKSTLLIVFVVVFIDLLGFGIVLPLLPRYGAHFNADRMQLGLLMASFSAMQFLFAPMWGALSDRIGRRPVLIVGLLGSTIAYFLFGVATALGREGSLMGLGPLPWLFITRIGAGIAGATIATAQAVIADSTGASGRGKGMALIGAAFGIGFTFGPLIGAACTTGAPSLALSDEQFQAVKNWESSDDTMSAEQLTTELERVGVVEDADRETIAAYLQSPRSRLEIQSAVLQPPSALPGYVAAVLSALALILAVLKLPESRPADSQVVVERERKGLLQLRQVAAHLMSGGFAVILLSIFITTFAFAQFESTLSLLTREFGYDSRNNFLLFAYIGFVLMIGQGVLVRRMLPRIGEHRMALTGVLLMVVGFGLIGLTGIGALPAGSLWVILPVVTIGFSAVTPSLQSLLSQSAAEDEQGAVLGSGQSLSSLARILGPAIGIPLMNVSAATPYFAGAVLMLVGGLQITRIRRVPSEQAIADS